jgi:hypothetical protein
MSPIDLGLDESGYTFEGSQEAAKVSPVTPATYEFAVDRIDDGNTSEGRPRWLVWLKILNAPTYPNRTLPYNAVLPWIDPATGLWSHPKEHFALTTLCDGTKKLWVGDVRKEEVRQALKGVLQGAAGFMRVGLRTYVDQVTGEKVTVNQVRIVTTKRR